MGSFRNIQTKAQQQITFAAPVYKSIIVIGSTKIPQTTPKPNGLVQWLHKKLLGIVYEDFV